MAQGLNKVKRRIQTVESTRKITGAMKLVSSVKVRQLQRNFDIQKMYEESIEDFTHTFINLKEENKETIYLKENDKSDKTLYIIVTSSLGLCGAYNYNVIKEFSNLYKKGDEVICIGSYITRQLQNDGGVTYYEEYKDIQKDLTMSNCRVLARHILEEYQALKYKKVVLLYTKYINSINFKVTSLRLLPFDVKGEPNKLNNTETEPVEGNILDKIAKKYLTSALFLKLNDSSLCEQASRRNAMDNADKNAEELVDKLKIEYNKARQTSITQEITEVVAGSMNK